MARQFTIEEMAKKLRRNKTAYISAVQENADSELIITFTTETIDSFGSPCTHRQNITSDELDAIDDICAPTSTFYSESGKFYAIYNGTDDVERNVRRTDEFLRQLSRKFSAGSPSALALGGMRD